MNAAAVNVPSRDISCKLKNQVARWEINANLTNSVITAQNLIASICGVATSATQVASVLYALKIKRIELRSPAVAASTTSSMNFEWFTPGGLTTGNEPYVMNGGSLGTAQGCLMKLNPPKHSVWENWITLTSPGSATCFTLSCPSGTTIDLIYDAYCDNNDSTLVTAGFTGLTVGANYRFGMDGLPTATSNYVVLGYRRA
jgi:hypothetical protein